LSGFVYIWFDSGKSKKQDEYRKYYIGCHWGTEDDGYICSSNWMRDAYKRRPQDFKRKILARVSSREELLEKEYYFLQLIKHEEIGKRYYNLHREKQNYFGHSNKGKKCGPCSEETKKKIAKSNTGKIRTEEHRKHYSESGKGRLHTEEWKAENAKRLTKQWASGERKGHASTEESRRKQSEANKGKQFTIPTEESRAKQSKARKALWADPSFREKMAASRKSKKL